ncbi:hypothetical protein ACFQ0D_31140 [Micromonospora zhanjiangensis]
MEREPLLVVDAANVVGSRPDGWWRDRAGANARLRDSLAPLARSGWAELSAPVEVVLVVEGAARRTAPVDGVRVVRADSSGDDAIVELVGAEPAGRRRVVVVTADRELRRQVPELGAEDGAPTWLRSAPSRPD